MSSIIVLKKHATLSSVCQHTTAGIVTTMTQMQAQMRSLRLHVGQPQSASLTASHVRDMHPQQGPFRRSGSCSAAAHRPRAPVEWRATRRAYRRMHMPDGVRLVATSCTTGVSSVRSSARTREPSFAS